MEIENSISLTFASRCSHVRVPFTDSRVFEGTSRHEASMIQV